MLRLRLKSKSAGVPEFWPEGRSSRKYLSLSFDLSQQSELCDWLRIWLKSKLRLKYFRELQSLIHIYTRRTSSGSWSRTVLAKLMNRGIYMLKGNFQIKWTLMLIWLLCFISCPFLWTNLHELSITSVICNMYHLYLHRTDVISHYNRYDHYNGNHYNPDHHNVHWQ